MFCFRFVQEELRGVESDGVKLAVVEFEDAEACEVVVMAVTTEGDVVDVDFFSRFQEYLMKRVRWKRGERGGGGREEGGGRRGGEGGGDGRGEGREEVKER